MAAWIDRILNLFKWPVAALAVVVLPGTVLALAAWFGRTLSNPGPVWSFALGMAGYLLVYRLLLRRLPLGSFFSTLEHELTHALFALLTLHRVVGLRATWQNGGRVSIRGQGNWLILIAPYFFPLPCLLVALAWLVVPERYVGAVNVLFGATLAWHIVSTWREFHAEQSDLKTVGWFFSVLFLPTANLLMLGAVASYALHGPGGLVTLAGDVVVQSRGFGQWLF